MLVVRVALAGRRSSKTSTLDKFAFIRSQSIGTVSEVTRLGRRRSWEDGETENGAATPDGSAEARTEEPGILTAFNERRICLSYNWSDVASANCRDPPPMSKAGKSSGGEGREGWAAGGRKPASWKLLEWLSVLETCQKVQAFQPSPMAFSRFPFLHPSPPSPLSPFSFSFSLSVTLRASNMRTEFLLRPFRSFLSFFFFLLFLSFFISVTTDRLPRIEEFSRIRVCVCRCARVRESNRVNYSHKTRFELAGTIPRLFRRSHISRLLVEYTVYETLFFSLSPRFTCVVWSLRNLLADSFENQQRKNENGLRIKWM